MEQSKAKTAEELVVKYKQKLEAVKSLLRSSVIPISSFTLAQEQCFTKFLEDLEALQKSKDEDELGRHYRILGLESENKKLKEALHGIRWLNSINGHRLSDAIIRAEQALKTT